MRGQELHLRYPAYEAGALTALATPPECSPSSPTGRACSGGRNDRAARMPQDFLVDPSGVEPAEPPCKGGASPATQARMRHGRYPCHLDDAECYHGGGLRSHVSGLLGMRPPVSALTGRSRLVGSPRPEGHASGRVSNELRPTARRPERRRSRAGFEPAFQLSSEWVRPHTLDDGRLSRPAGVDPAFHPVRWPLPPSGQGGPNSATALFPTLR